MIIKRSSAFLLASLLWVNSPIAGWQSPPDPDASLKEIIDFYAQSYGAPTQLDDLTSFQVKWEITNRSRDNTSRHSARSLVGVHEMVWAGQNWRTRSWLGSEMREGIGLIDNGQDMFHTTGNSSGRLGQKARRANHLIQFVQQGGVPMGYWPKIADQFQLVGHSEFNGQPTWQLQATSGHDRTILFISQKTGLAVRIENRSLESSNGDLNYSWTLTDFQPVDGIIVPHRIEMDSTYTPPTAWKLLDISFNQPIQQSIFKVRPRVPVDARGFKNGRSEWEGSRGAAEPQRKKDKTIE